MWNIMNVFKIRVLKKVFLGCRSGSVGNTYYCRGPQFSCQHQHPHQGVELQFLGNVDLWPPRELAFTHTHT